MARIFGFMENVWFITAIAILGGVMGALVYPALWVVFVVMMMLALYRSKEVSDQPGAVQVLAYSILLVVCGAVIWGSNSVVNRYSQARIAATAQAPNDAPTSSILRVAPGATAKDVLVDGSPALSSGPATTIDDHGTLERAEARNSPAIGGVSQPPPSNRALISLPPGANRVTLDNVHFIGSGFDTLVAAQGDVQYLAVTGSGMESKAAAVKLPSPPKVGKSNKK